MSVIMETCETPTDEMKRLIREIGGPKMPGEADAHVRSRAQRQLNRFLPKARHITDRTAYAYWHGERDDVLSHHMDAARRLAEPAKTLDQHLSAIIEASQRVEHAEQERLADALAIIRSASLWRFLDRRSRDGLSFVGPDRRRADAPQHSVLSEALYPSLTSVSGAPQPSSSRAG